MTQVDRAYRQGRCLVVSVLGGGDMYPMYIAVYDMTS